MNKSRPCLGLISLLCKTVRTEPTVGGCCHQGLAHRVIHIPLCSRLPCTPAQVSLVPGSPGRGIRTHTAVGSAILPVSSSCSAGMNKPYCGFLQKKPSARGCLGPSPGPPHAVNPGSRVRGKGTTHRGTVLPQSESDGPGSSVCLSLSAEWPWPFCALLSLSVKQRTGGSPETPARRWFASSEADSGLKAALAFVCFIE